MSAEIVAHYLGVILGAFVVISIFSRLAWYIASKIGGARVGMVAALCFAILILILRWTSTARPLDVVHEFASVVAVLMWLFLDWRIALEREQKQNTPNE